MQELSSFLCVFVNTAEQMFQTPDAALSVSLQQQFDQVVKVKF